MSGPVPAQERGMRMSLPYPQPCSTRPRKRGTLHGLRLMLTRTGSRRKQRSTAETLLTPGFWLLPPLLELLELLPLLDDHLAPTDL